MEKLKIITKKDVNELPKTTGVYLFFASPKLSEGGLRKPIYIGKAINIKDRVKNHLQQPNYKDNLFIDKISKVGFIKTDSEIEALILEAGLIKKYQPKFNVIWKDDKNYFYVAVTKSLAPIIYINQKKKEKAEYIGPFVDGNSLKKILKFLRRSFPYYTSKKHPKNNCPWCHLELCPGPPPRPEGAGEARSQSERQSFEKEYKKNIKKLVLILKGKKNTVLNSLKKEMRQSSLKKEFEEAAKIRDIIYNLQKVMNHTHVIENNWSARNASRSDVGWNKTEKILKEIVGVKKSISRIEAYDVSNIQGKQATGVMIVFINGRPEKNLYRKFKIKTVEEPNDIVMLKETLKRRFSHPEWKRPEIILIDGGKAQLNVGVKVKKLALSEAEGSKKEISQIKIISIAKRNKELFIENRKKPILLKTLPREIFNLIINLDDEAHRFAIAYHKKLRKKYLLK